MARDLFPRELQQAHRQLPDWLSASGAIFSADGRRRYRLTRKVGAAGARIACFIMVNPSKAGAVENDNTVARCIEFARLWDCGWLVVVNLLPWISTDPLGLYLVPAEELLDPKNIDYALEAARAATISGGPVVCAWGTHGAYMDQDMWMLHQLERARVSAHCLGKTAEGYPRHPGRIAYSTRLEPYPPEWFTRKRAKEML